MPEGTTGKSRGWSPRTRELVSVMGEAEARLGGRTGEGAEDLRLWDGIINSTDMSISQLREMVKAREAWWLQSMGLQRVRHDLATKLELSGSFLEPD